MCHGIVCNRPSCGSFGIAVLENKVYTFWKTRQPVLGKGPHTIYFGKGHMYVLGKRHRAMFLGKEIEKDMLLEKGNAQNVFLEKGL